MTTVSQGVAHTGEVTSPTGHDVTGWAGGWGDVYRGLTTKVRVRQGGAKVSAEPEELPQVARGFEADLETAERIASLCTEMLTRIGVQDVQ